MIMNWTNLLGIYPDTIERVFDTCDDALQAVRDFVSKIGYDSDAEHLDFKLHEVVLADLEDVGINGSQIATSVIDACLDTTSGFLNNTEIFCDLGIEAEFFTDGSPCYLNIIDSWAEEGAYDSDEIERRLYDKFSDCLCTVVIRQMCDENRDIPEGDNLQEIIIRGLKNDEYNVADILACFKDGEVKGAFRALVDNYPVQEEQAKIKDAKEGKKETFDFEF